MKPAAVTEGMPERSFEDIERLALEQLHNAGLYGVYPVNLETVAGNIGFKTMFFRGKPEVSGAIDHRQKTIFVNQEENVQRQRFTLAHEIGHAVLHGGSDEVDFRKDIDSPRTRKEIEANSFAANLLMPREHFSQVWKTQGRAWAELRFGVSQSAAKYRALNLGLTHV